MANLTFSLDDETIRMLRRLAAQRQKPQSYLVREAIAAYAAEGERLNEQERARKLRVLDQLRARPHTRAQREVDAELREIRRARRTGWRRQSD